MERMEYWSIGVVEKWSDGSSEEQEQRISKIDRVE
jgi:hypothetical protein